MLKKVKVEAALYVVASGHVGLSAAQAKTRAHNLKAVLVGHDGAGEYEVVNAIQFKRGEEFGFDGKVGKDGVLTAAEPETAIAAAADATLPPPAKAGRKLSAATTAVKGMFGR